ncbi:SPFH domain / Band 7 family protein [Andreprevotia lacus DSM 23236]|uniref:SPFH domain / Band 7 family protein n=2 Tax=Andreprevotia TaxID=397275 RepID=A0A1W1XTH3_9NEIS|nr:SPFH domain / Band 7 family protein [Andreprevotia lacus DSM 23236]
MRTRTPLVVATLATLLAGCSHYAKNEIETVEPNETAFLIPLRGDSKQQTQTNSIEYLEKNKIQAKTVEIPHQLVRLCDSTFQAADCLRDVAMYRLIKVSRTPVSREWTKDPGTGSNPADDALHVESVESIGFYMGASVTAHVADENAARFQYYFAGQPLSHIIDDQVRKFILTRLSEKTGAMKLDEIRATRASMFKGIRDETVAHFAAMGVTIDNLGYTDGMSYENKQIQQAIDKQFEASALAETARQQARAAEEFAKAQAATTAMVDLELKKKLVDAQVEMMHKFNGQLPTTLVIGGNSGEGFAGALTGAMLGNRK